ncbi:hypothetical protein quinque_002428 [Culex quinquefasciatus]
MVMRNEWCVRNFLTISIEKCSTISFHRKLKPVVFDYAIAGNTLARVTQEDISVQVQKQAEAAKTEKKKFRFESVDTGAKNTASSRRCWEIRPNCRSRSCGTRPKPRSKRAAIKPVPIEVVTKANLKDGAGKLFDRYIPK